MLSRLRHPAALDVYQRLRQRGLAPDAFTVVSLLKVFRNDGLHQQAFMVSSLLLGPLANGRKRVTCAQADVA